MVDGRVFFLLGVLSIGYGWIWKRDRALKKRIGDTAIGLAWIVGGVAYVQNATDSILMQLVVGALTIGGLIAYFSE